MPTTHRADAMARSRRRWRPFLPRSRLSFPVHPVPFRDRPRGVFQALLEWRPRRRRARRFRVPSNRKFGGHWRKGPASWSGNPSREMETKEFWEVFGGCMSKLPQGLADAFFLRELDGLSADEVQDALGITPANFWKRLHRARSLLRQCLESSWFSQRTKRSTPSVRGRSNS